MEQAKIAAKSPAVLELEAGKYAWCRCGLSKGQPYCDGSHANSSFQPVRFELKEKKRVALCNCKQTNNQPYCDGSHSKL